MKSNKSGCGPPGHLVISEWRIKYRNLYYLAVINSFVQNSAWHMQRVNIYYVYVGEDSLLLLQKVENCDVVCAS